MCIATMSLTEAYQHCQDQLTEAGLLISLGVPGLYGFNGVFEDVIERSSKGLEGVRPHHPSLFFVRFSLTQGIRI